MGLKISIKELNGLPKPAGVDLGGCMYNDLSNDFCINRAVALSRKISCCEVCNCMSYEQTDKRVIRTGTIIKHFKGNKYIVLNIAEHVNNGSKFVIYTRVEKDIPKVWARDYDEFMSEVDREKYPDVEQKYRFEIEIY